MFSNLGDESCTVNVDHSSIVAIYDLLLTTGNAAISSQRLPFMGMNMD